MRSRRPLAAALLVLLSPLPLAGEEINRIVLRVNDQIVTLAQYEDRVAARRETIARAEGVSADEKRRLSTDAGRSAMRELFEELLVLSRARQLHLEASPAEIDRAVDVARRRFGIETDEEFEQGLISSGSSIAEFRARMAQNLLFNEVLQREIQPRIKVDDEEVARYWREHPQEFAVPEKRKVEEIVVRDTAPGTPDERRALAAALRDLLVEGKTLAEALAARNAADHALVLEHGWIERGTLDAALETTVFELGAGGIGGPLDGRGGLHVIRVLEIEPERVEGLDKVRERITVRLQEERFETEGELYIDELAAKAFVVENLPPEAAGYRSAPSGDRDPVRELMRRKPDAADAPAASATPNAEG